MAVNTSRTFKGWCRTKISDLVNGGGKPISLETIRGILSAQADRVPEKNNADRAG